MEISYTRGGCGVRRIDGDSNVMEENKLWHHEIV